MGERIGVTDEEWAIIRPLLPLERGRWSRPAQDNRRYFEGMLWIARSGSQWRHLPDEYGKWNSVFRRFRRWVEIGVFDALIETLVELVKRDRSADMVDTTIIRAHHCAAGKKKGDSRSRGPWPFSRRVLDQNPCPVRRQRSATWLHDNAGTST